MRKLVLILSLLLNLVFVWIFYIYSSDCEGLEVGLGGGVDVLSSGSGVGGTLLYKEPFTRGDIEELKSFIDYGSILLVDRSDNVFIDYNSFVRMTPASTLKVLTSLASLYYLGEDFRFETVFSLDSGSNLHIKGYGDPIITSRELSYIVRYLRYEKGVREINSIYLDGSYFPEFIMVPGNEDTYESYDSKNGALAVNFNTILLRSRSLGRRFSGRVVSLLSGELETPYVDFAKYIFEKARVEDSRVVDKREFRISIKDYEDSLLYFGHLFKAFCVKFGIKVNGIIGLGSLSEGLGNLYVHRSRQTLREVVNSLMLFSNNYVANQLLIMIGVSVIGGEPSLEKGILVLDRFVRENLRIDGMSLSEGSGLSYANRVSARQMVEVLNYFRPYKGLLKPLGDDVYVKSGALKSVSSYVGYIDSERYGELRFAILLNQSKDNKDKLLGIIRKSLL